MTTKKGGQSDSTKKVQVHTTQVEKNHINLLKIFIQETFCTSFMILFVTGLDAYLYSWDYLWTRVWFLVFVVINNNTYFCCSYI